MNFLIPWFKNSWLKSPATLLITFDKLPCFVPSFEPTNTFPILIERNREVIEDEMVEEIEENDEDYGNMGCQVLKRGIQH